MESRDPLALGHTPPQQSDIGRRIRYIDYMATMQYSGPSFHGWNLPIVATYIPAYILVLYIIQPNNGLR